MEVSQRTGYDELQKCEITRFWYGGRLIWKTCAEHRFGRGKIEATGKYFDYLTFPDGYDGEYRLMIMNIPTDLNYTAFTCASRDQAFVAAENWEREHLYRVIGEDHMFVYSDKPFNSR